MSTADADFLQQLRATFREEAEEHLQAITTGLMQLEGALPAEQQKPVVEAVFRAAHSLKGAARAVDFREVEAACESLEDTFASWKRQEAAPTPQSLDQLHARVSRLAALLAPPAGSAAPVAGAPESAVAVEPPAAAPAAPRPASGQTVRISAEVLDARLLEAEEMLTVKLAAGQRAEDLRALSRELRGWRHEAAGAPPQRLQERLNALQGRIAGLTQAAEQDREAVAKLVDDLLANAKALLLLPFSTISAGFPKLVRDLCRDQGKEAELQIEGDAIPLDKRILDAIKDPLVHLLRNCVDHGIEPPQERLRRGKPARARIRLALAQLAGQQVRITLEDDGAGIDVAKVKAAAVRQGLLGEPEAAALDDAAAQALVFRSGVSTSPLLTSVSGRGLGLAIVQEKAAQLGGEVSVSARAGEGTTFRIVVPARRATFRGILLQAGGRLLVAPTTQVERVLQVRRQAIVPVEGRDTITFEGRVLPVLPLARLLELPAAPGPRGAPAAVRLVVLGTGEAQIACAVDEVLDEQELLVKPLRPPLSRVRNVASATVLPDGAIALILHVGDLLRSARGVGGPSLRTPPPALPVAAKSILVAEDSITSRMLIKGMLEAAGYRVATAPDGLEALRRLQADSFDLLVSDVEMPRLNGFDLTARVRADARLAALPVVLVTALEQRADRERGVAAGASAYIVKSSFDQSTLVEAVRRLL